jgi:hypothetical protein
MPSREHTSASFRQALDQLRRTTAERPSALRIAEVATKTGASAQEALEAIQRLQFGSHPSGQGPVLPQLIRELAQLLNIKRVLETGEMASLLSVRLLEPPSEVKLTYLTRNTDIADAGRVPPSGVGAVGK